MSENIQNNEEVKIPKKRGRKPLPKPNKNYFIENEEQAVLRYLETDDLYEKNQIFNTILQPAFNKMVESIIRRYKLYVPNEEFDEIFNDTMSFLLTKMDKFTPGKYKAYSYYGTICKNYLIGRIQSYNKSVIRNPSYNTSDEVFENSMKYMVQDNTSAKIASEIIERLILKINQMIDEPKKFQLKNSEILVGKALINLFNNWDYVLTTDGSNKLNKNTILFFLRESTGLDTKGVRDNMKKFKKEFSNAKNFVLNV